MNLGPAEILVILVLALLVFGPKRLPEVGRQIGGAMREIRKVQHTVQSEINDALREPAPTLPAAPSASKASSEPDDHESDSDRSGDGDSDDVGETTDRSADQEADETSESSDSSSAPD